MEQSKIEKKWIEHVCIAWRIFLVTGRLPSVPRDIFMKSWQEETQYAKLLLYLDLRYLKLNGQVEKNPTRALNPIDLCLAGKFATFLGNSAVAIQMIPREEYAIAVWERIKLRFGEIVNVLKKSDVYVLNILR